MKARVTLMGTLEGKGPRGANAHDGSPKPALRASVTAPYPGRGRFETGTRSESDISQPHSDAFGRSASSENQIFGRQML